MEWHAERKVFECDTSGVAVLDDQGNKIPLNHPRWRSILVQATVDHIVQFVLFKQFSLSELMTVQGGNVDKIVAGVSLVL